MARYWVMKDGVTDHSVWDNLSKAKTECDSAKLRYGSSFTVEKRETIYSSDTLDELLKVEV